MWWAAAGGSSATGAEWSRGHGRERVKRRRIGLAAARELIAAFQEVTTSALARDILDRSLQAAEAGRLAVRILKRRGHALDAPVLIDAQAGAVAGLRGAGAREGFSTEPGDAVAGDPLPAPSHRINIAGESVS
jgi:hypothetical protein